MASPLGLAKLKQQELFFVSSFVRFLGYAYAYAYCYAYSYARM